MLMQLSWGWASLEEHGSILESTITYSPEVGL